MVTRVRFEPGNFKTINGINYFRLESGEIAVEKVDNVIVKSDVKTSIELVTCQKEELIAKFWLVDGMEINALASDSWVDLIPGSKFVDMYNAENGVYIKYTADDSFWILYVNETSVDDILSSKTDITFDGDYFYTHEEDKFCEDHFCIINKAGEVIEELNFEAKKVKNYGGLYYNQNSLITSDNTVKVEVDGMIDYVEVITNCSSELLSITFESLSIIKVVTDQGSYFYSEDMELLAGPLIKGTVKYIDDSSCYIFEEKIYGIVSVFYIVKEKTSFFKKLLSSEGVIRVHTTSYVESIKSGVAKSTYWFEEERKENRIYAYSYDLQCIMKDMAEVYWDDVYRSTNNEKMYFIVGYNEIHEPVKLYIHPHLSSIHENNNWSGSNKPQLISLEVLCHKAGENGWICKDEKQDKLYFIGMPYRNGSFSRAGELVCREGHSCTLEQVYFPKMKFYNTIYLVRDGQNRIYFYSENGEIVLIG